MPLDASSGFQMISLLNIASSQLINSTGLHVVPATTTALLQGYMLNITNSSGALSAASGAAVNAQITNLINWGTSLATYNSSALITQSTMNMVGGFIGSLLGAAQAPTKISG